MKTQTLPGEPATQALMPKTAECQGAFNRLGYERSHSFAARRPQCGDRPLFRSKRFHRGLRSQRGLSSFHGKWLMQSGLAFRAHSKAPSRNREGARSHRKQNRRLESTVSLPKGSVPFSREIAEANRLTSFDGPPETAFHGPARLLKAPPIGSSHSPAHSADSLNFPPVRCVTLLRWVISIILKAV